MLLGRRNLMDQHQALHPYRALSNDCAGVRYGSSFIVSSSSNTCATVKADELRQTRIWRVPNSECNNVALYIMATLIHIKDTLKEKAALYTCCKPQRETPLLATRHGTPCGDMVIHTNHQQVWKV